MTRRESHEDYTARAEVRMGSDRSFGLVFTFFFAALGAWRLYAGPVETAWKFLIAAALLLVISLAAPQLLRPFNRVWFRFGELLHKMVNPLLLGAIWIFAIVPTALAMRLLGKDPLNLRFKKDAETYWIRRAPPGPTAESMRNQF